MDVTLEPHIGLCRKTGMRPRFDQYRIRVDGMHAGFIGFRPGSKVLLSVRYGPLELKEIERKVAEILEQESVSAKQVSEIPEGFLEKENQTKEVEEVLNDDDFDS